MTPSELKYELEQRGSYYFSRDTLKFFGDTIRNYGVRSKPVTITTSRGEEIQCWELYRRKPVKGGLWASAYFEVETFERKIPRIDEVKYAI